MKKLKLLAAVITVFVGAYCVLPCFRFSPKSAQALDIGGTYDEETLEEYFSSFDYISLNYYEITGFLFDQVENLENYNFEIEDNNDDEEGKKTVLDLELVKVFDENDIDREIWDDTDPDADFDRTPTTISFDYRFLYSKESNEFYLTVMAMEEGGIETIDELRGYPFPAEENSEEIDVAFWFDDAPLYLSDLETMGMVSNSVCECGFFGKMLEFIAVAASVMAGVAAAVAVVTTVAPMVVMASVAAATAGVVPGVGVAVVGELATLVVAGSVGCIVGFAVYKLFNAAIAATAAWVESIESKVTILDDIDERIDATITSIKEERPDDTIIFRWGNKTYSNLTPKPGKDDDLEGRHVYKGLSMTSLVPYGKKCCLTTVELVNSTSVLFANYDGGEMAHYTVAPTDQGAFAEWLESYDNAMSDPHIYTQLLYSITFSI